MKMAAPFMFSFFAHLYPFPESPRDASNKDSPASQADSGVYSIASSNSPSKDGANSGTSPDSPNGARMGGPYEQNMQRDCECICQIFLSSIILNFLFFLPSQGNKA